MAKILIFYYSQTGNTKRMAELIAMGAKEVNNDVTLKPAEEVTADELLDYKAIIIGSPTYYGTMAYQVKKILDESVRFHGKLDGRIGGAFSSSANVGGGNETTVLAIINALLIHGMIVQGDCSGDHYGPVSIGKPDARVEKQCRRYGRRMAELAQAVG